VLKNVITNNTNDDENNKSKENFYITPNISSYNLLFLLTQVIAISIYFYLNGKKKLKNKI